MRLNIAPSSTAERDLLVHTSLKPEQRRQQKRVWESAHYILGGDSKEDLTIVRVCSEEVHPSIASEDNTTALSELLEEVDLFDQERLGNITAQEEPLGEIIKALFQKVQSITFEDGMENYFSRELVCLVRQYGKTATEVITTLIVNDNVGIEVAAEALRWLGRMDHPPSRYDRSWLLERSLFSTSVLVRDGAALGLASLDDPHAIPYLQQAIEREKYASLREDLKQVLAQLESTRSATSPEKHP
jgi:hypothetical protein